MNAPVTYVQQFLGKELADRLFHDLWNELPWLRHDKVPRREYFVSRVGEPYAYGVAPYTRTYWPQPMHDAIDCIWKIAQEAAACNFDVCFLNGYEDGKDHLGWHADDSPEMDDARPIAIVTLGAEREIWFRGKDRSLAGFPVGEPFEKLVLQHASLCLMAPGMQDTHQHRIPKAGFECGPRISLTFRGYKEN